MKRFSSQMRWGARVEVCLVAISKGCGDGVVSATPLVVHQPLDPIQLVFQRGAACLVYGKKAPLEKNYFTETCSDSEAGSYLRLIDFVYHSTLGLRVIHKRRGKGAGD